MRDGYRKPTAFGVVPAKGASTGLPGKNMMLMRGHPMIHYILMSALGATMLDEVWVSTENDQIEEYCSGLSVRVLRHDPSLSGETSPTFGVIENILSYWESLKRVPDIVVTMRATSPLCTADDIDRAVHMLLNSKADSVIAVVKSDVHPHRILSIDANGFLQHTDPNSPERHCPIRRQELSPVYIRTGAIYATRRGVIKKGSLWGTRALPYIFPKKRATNVNDEIDFFLAENLLLEGQESPIAGHPLPRTT